MKVKYKISAFADDTKLSGKSGSETETYAKILQKDLKNYCNGHRIGKCFSI